jgi:hypothetical protein
MRIGILGSGLMRVKLGTIQVQLKGFKKWKSKELDRNLLKGPSGWFTGTVRLDPLFQAPDPALGPFCRY